MKLKNRLKILSYLFHSHCTINVKQILILTHLCKWYLNPPWWFCIFYQNHHHKYQMFPSFGSSSIWSACHLAKYLRVSSTLAIWCWGIGWSSINHIFSTSVPLICVLEVRMSGVQELNSPWVFSNPFSRVFFNQG